MRKHIKYKKDSKERCLRILVGLAETDEFQYLVDNMIAETFEESRGVCMDMNCDNVHLPVTQGVAQSFRELTDLCRNARGVLERMQKPKPRTPTI